MGMYLMRQIGTRGVYGNPILPDFMVFLNWKELPWFWYGFDHFPVRRADGAAGAGPARLRLRLVRLPRRVTGVYLSIITQAMTYALLLAFFRNDMGFGGNNGLTDFKDILGFNVQADATRAALFALSAHGAGLASYLLCRWIVASKLGKVLIAVRDAESRTRFLGYRVEHYKLFVFTLSAVMAGIAGALYVPQVGIINPERVRARQLDRGGDLGRGRRPRHAGRPDRSAPSLVNCAARPGSPARCRSLAVRARRPVRRRHAVPAQGHRRRCRGRCAVRGQSAAREAPADVVRRPAE